MACARHAVLAAALAVASLGALLPPTAAAAASKPNILFIMADDLGRQDLGFRNNFTTYTPAINRLRADGVWLDSHHAFKICAPTRASAMVGRYPQDAGFYDMSQDDNHCTAHFTTFPELLQKHGYKTAAFGKWDTGFADKACSPTYRGFDHFVGYYQACQMDYWYHTVPAGTETCGAKSHNQTYGTDLSNNTISPDGVNHINPARGWNGTYSRDVYTKAAVDTIHAHAAGPSKDSPLMLYFAPQNVHLGCLVGPDAAKTKHGVQAPCGTIDMFPHIEEDVWKGQAGMLAELDFGVGNVTAALKEAGMWENTIVVFQSDNGGPLPHCANGPMRGGKWTFWEGGVRVAAFVSGPALPASVPRGSSWTGLSHTADWYRTLVEGVAGGTVPSNTGPVPDDSHNLWRAITTMGTSPRTEVVHQLNNTFYDEHVSAMRVGDYKLIRGEPGDDRTQYWPKNAAEPVPWGQSGGLTEPGTDHCRVKAMPQQPAKGHCQPYCLFDVVNDPGEQIDLSGNAAYAGIIANISARLDYLGSRAPDPEIARAYNKTTFPSAVNAFCAGLNKTGFLEPANWEGPSSSGAEL